MSDKKAIGTSYDLDYALGANAFDPVAWFEGTGEDLGLPEGYVDDFNATLAKMLEKVRAERAAEGRHLPGHHDQMTHAHGGSGLPTGAGTKDDPIRTADVEVAQQALAPAASILRASISSPTMSTMPRAIPSMSPMPMAA